jgi:hypothetical protein
MSTTNLVPHAVAYRRVVCSLSLGLVVLTAGNICCGQSPMSTESPFDTGVFARPPLSSAEFAAYEASVKAAARMSRPEVGRLEFDATGDTNELILLPDPSSGPLRALVPAFVPDTKGLRRIEDEIVAKINARDTATLKSFGSPLSARYFVDDDRMDNATRSALSSDDPDETLLRYVVLRYPTVAGAVAANNLLSRLVGVANVGINHMASWSFVPNDPYFAKSNATDPAQFQWGMNAMNFPSAWNTTLGFGYIGDIDSGFVNDTPPTDIAANYRSQFSVPISAPTAGFEAHGTHVGGILVGVANNASGISGGCPNCSLAEMRTSTSNMANLTTGIKNLTDRGVQVVNMSFENDTANAVCGGSFADINLMCNAISAGTTRDIMYVASAGNFRSSTPAFPASDSDVLAVGGAQIATPPPANPFVYPYPWQQWISSSTSGTTYPGTNGVIAPAASVVSTIPPWSTYITTAPYCADSTGADNSGPAGDGYGNCTGTSMSAPHVSALAGIARSINPRLSAIQIKTTIRQQSGSFTGTYMNNGTPTQATSKGMPNAATVVSSTVSQTPNKLTPLFSFYSAGRYDYFYSTVPQMGAAAIMGTLEPRNGGSQCTISYIPTGTTIFNYTFFPGTTNGVCPNQIVAAQVWVFTTTQNPKNASDPLVPLYRMSWKCGDPSSNQPAVCITNGQHIDVTYTTDAAGIAAFQNVGYKLDGTEGYIYPKTSAQPTGTVKLMRKYNPARDDHAIFPDTLLTDMTNQGYTQNSGSDYIGYVYINNGGVPTIQ